MSFVTKGLLTIPLVLSTLLIKSQDMALVWFDEFKYAGPPKGIDVEL